MDFSFTEEQQMLQDSIRRYLETSYGLEHRAGILASDAGWSATTWAELADLGLLALDLAPPLRHFVARRMIWGARAWP